MNFISLTTRVYLSIMVLLLIPFSVWNVERLHNIVLKVYCYLPSAKIRFIYINISILSIILSMCHCKLHSTNPTCMHKHTVRQTSWFVHNIETTTMFNMTSFEWVYIMRCMQRKSNLEPTNRFLVFHKIQQSHATITASC